MRGAKYAGFLAVLMAIMILGAIPAVAVRSEDTGAREGEEKDERVNDRVESDDSNDVRVARRPIKIVRGKFIGPITDEDGAENGRIFGLYTLYMTADGSTKGRFLARWKYNDIKGKAMGVMRNGELKGRWTELPQRPTLDAANDEPTDADENEVCIHYGTLMGKYELMDDGIVMRGSWEDSVSGETGYFKAEEYTPDEPPKGRFKGVWISVDTENETPDVRGKLYGIYIKNPNRPGGRFAGRWTLGDDEKGTIHGQYRGGNFKGVWRNVNGNVGGYLHGTYGEGTFSGRWFHRDGTPGGYLKGEYGLKNDADASVVATEDRPVVAEA